MFKNSSSWIAATLLAASSLFAQSNGSKCPAPPEPMPAPTMAAYNGPARIDVKGCWDMYVDASFIYWQPLQDNMEFGINTTDTTSPRTMFGTSSAPVSNNLINLNTDYKPGFQVGLGMNYDYDNWDSYLQYTWFHNTNTSSSNGTGSAAILQTYGHPASVTSDVAPEQDTASASWNLKIDLADFQLARSYYVGTKLTFRPYFGLRGAWIRQKYNLTYVNTTSSPGTDGTYTVNNRSTSWAIGPEAGMNASYLFCCGLRAYGDVESDLTYTHYRTSFSSATTGTSAETLSVKESGLGSVRPHCNIDLGLGWGMYFDNNNWHFDLAASYGFQVFWDQNMFRKFNDNSMQGSSEVANGNLYLHGLNLTARFDF